jgi:4-hydroxybenzoate polyprenyltransferase
MGQAPPPGQAGRSWRSGAGRAVALLRLLHPFPSILDALVVAGLALVAGAAFPAALRAALAMLLLQFAIGATNDLVDAPADRRVAPHKPIPAGLATPAAARGAAIALATGGLLLAAAAGLVSLAIAGAGLAAGLAYDLRLKRTAWSWLPYAAGIPLLVVFGWAGAGLPVPAFVVALAPLAGLAGAQLAIANALADLERDRATGVRTVATGLGRRRAWRLLIVVAAVTLASAWSIVAAVGSDVAPIAALAAGTALVTAGVASSALDTATGRRRAWEVQAVGLGLLALGVVATLLGGG